MDKHPSLLTFDKRYKAILNPQLVMPKGMRKVIKNLLTFLPNLNFARSAAYAPLLRQWKKEHITKDTEVFRERMELFDFLIREFSDKEFLFLEFGCASGNVIKHLSQKCTHPDARFVGFDTFTGLPEKWQVLTWSVDVGTWDLGGKIPQIDDSRVSFQKGLFQDTLPRFIASNDWLTRYPEKIISIDGDLYSSALVVLSRLCDHLNGTIFYFDEFDCVMDEFRALEDFSKAFRKEYNVIAVTDWCDQIALRFKP